MVGIVPIFGRPVACNCYKCFTVFGCALSIGGSGRSGKWFDSTKSLVCKEVRLLRRAQHKCGECESDRTGVAARSIRAPAHGVCTAMPPQTYNANKRGGGTN